MRNTFPLFQSHLDLAHQYWSQIVQVGDTVIDATCGNGKDTIKLCELALGFNIGKVYAIDTQESAILSTRQSIHSFFPRELFDRVEFHQRCHSVFPDTILPQSIKLVVYNLGYLPGGDKTLTTETTTTLQSLSHAQKLLQPGGLITMNCYPGHPEGAREQNALLTYVLNLSSKWSCCHHVWINRPQAPTLLLIQNPTIFL